MARADAFFAKNGRERGDLVRIQVKHFVVQGQTVGFLDHAQHDLTRDQTLLGHAKVPHIVILLPQPFGANGRHVVENDRQLLIDKRAQQVREYLLDFVPALDEGIHGGSGGFSGSEKAADASLDEHHNEILTFKKYNNNYIYLILKD